MGSDSPTPTTSQTKRRVSLLLAFVCSAGFLYLALRNVDLGDAVATARSANIWLLLLALGGYSVSLFLRGFRWGTLLSRSGVPMSLAVWVSNGGYLLNQVLPARSGDVARSLVVAQKARISRTFALATTALERIVDALVLVGTCLLVTFFVPGLPDWLRSGSIALMAVGIGILGIAGALLWAAKKHKHITAKIPVLREPHVRAMGRQLALGLSALSNVRSAVTFAILTIAAWLLDSMMMALVAHSMGIDLGLMEALLFLGALAVASVIPSTPGFIGIYQFVAVSVLPTFGIDEHDALALIIVVQLIGYVSTGIWGTIGLTWAGGARTFIDSSSKTDIVEPA